MNTWTAPLVRLTRALDGLAEWTGRAISWLTLLLVLDTFAVVVLRYLFSVGWIAMQESMTYLHAFVFLLGAAYTLRHDGHVRVDIVYRDLGPRARAWLDLLGTFVFLVPVCAFILWSSWGYVASSWALHEGSEEAGGLPLVYILKTAIPVMAVLMLIQGLSQTLHCVLTIAGVEGSPSGHRPADTEL
ncbi:MAG TPA: TRAP transporter small permease subunit [Gammaproteobacteria bacterium]|nr:TRAP transporter small permease subunit [Gammaproteobacteria bacterium]